MHMLWLKHLKTDARGPQRGHFGMLFGDAGLFWAPFGATCCSRGFYMQQYSIYAVFARFFRGWLARPVVRQSRAVVVKADPGPYQ